MNLIKVLIGYAICLLICVSLFLRCVPNVQKQQTKINYTGKHIDKISNIGIDNYEINFNTDDSNRIRSFGYYKNDTIPNGLIALFYENGNLNNLFNTDNNKRIGSSIFCNKTGEVLSLNNFNNDLEDGFQYEKIGNRTCVISFYEKGILIKRDTITVN